MTGIKGQYHWNLYFAGNPHANSPGRSRARSPQRVPGTIPSIFDALRQYNLRLESRVAPVEMLVITHIEKMPTES